MISTKDGSYTETFVFAGKQRKAVPYVKEPAKRNFYKPTVEANEVSNEKLRALTYPAILRIVVQHTGINKAGILRGETNKDNVVARSLLISFMLRELKLRYKDAAFITGLTLSAVGYCYMRHYEFMKDAQYKITHALIDRELINHSNRI